MEVHKCKLCIIHPEDYYITKVSECKHAICLLALNDVKDKKVCKTCKKELSKSIEDCPTNLDLLMINPSTKEKFYSEHQEKKLTDKVTLLLSKKETFKNSIEENISLLKDEFVKSTEQKYSSLKNELMTSTDEEFSSLQKELMATSEQKNLSLENELAESSEKKFSTLETELGSSADEKFSSLKTELASSTDKIFSSLKDEMVKSTDQKYSSLKDEIVKSTDQKYSSLKDEMGKSTDQKYSSFKDELVKSTDQKFSSLEDDLVTSSKKNFFSLKDELVASTGKKYSSLKDELIASTKQNFFSLKDELVKSTDKKITSLKDELVTSTDQKYSSLKNELVKKSEDGISFLKNDITNSLENLKIELLCKLEHSDEVERNDLMEVIDRQNELKKIFHCSCLRKARMLQLREFISKKHFLYGLFLRLQNKEKIYACESNENGSWRYGKITYEEKEKQLNIECLSSSTVGNDVFAVVLLQDIIDCIDTKENVLLFITIGNQKLIFSLIEDVNSESLQLLKLFIGEGGNTLKGIEVSVKEDYSEAIRDSFEFLGDNTCEISFPFEEIAGKDAIKPRKIKIDNVILQKFTDKVRIQKVYETKPNFRFPNVIGKLNENCDIDFKKMIKNKVEDSGICFPMNSFKLKRI